VLLDIVPGSLCWRCFFISYLESGHYLEVEKEPPLVEVGRKHETAE
jgi:hypothetical protein